MDEQRQVVRGGGNPAGMKPPRGNVSDIRTPPIGINGLACIWTDKQGDAVAEKESLAERMLIISLAVTLEKIQNKTGPEAVDELNAILQYEQFSLQTFNKMIKGSDDCKTITDDFIKEWKQN